VNVNLSSEIVNLFLILALLHYSPMPFSRRTFLRFLGLTGIGLMFGGSAGVAQIFRFGVNRYQHRMGKLKKPLRLAHLSDLHFGAFVHTALVKKWVDATLQEAPDVILITGDFIDRTTQDFQALVAELARLEAPLGVWGIWGNHDYDHGLEYRDRFAAALARVGIKMLVNQGVSLRDDVFLCGCDDIWNGEHDLEKSFAGQPQDQACIFMCHNPDIIPGLAYYNYDADLTLSGHLHGGQVKLPFLGAPFVSSKYGQKFLEGWVLDPMPAFISRGLGVSGLPIRRGSQPEVVIIDLLPQG
jgi:uncharacterized protein